LLKRTGRQYRRRRSQFSSQADKLNGHWTSRGRFHGNPNPTKAERRKAKHIRRNNLGSERKNNELRRARAEVSNINGRAARELVEAYPNASIFREEKLNFQSANKKP